MNASPTRRVHAALHDVTVRFGDQLAVDRLSLDFPPGCVHAVVGENGAGKSTAMNVLFGLRAPDAGHVEIDGRVRRLRSPREAIDAGLGMVHQHFTLLDRMSVLENVVLCAEPDAGAGFVDFARARATLERLVGERGLDIDPDARVGRLPFGRRQLVEIAKALYRDARLLVLDEPTAVLTPRETDALFAILRALRAEGRGIVLITHKLDEVTAIADRVSVMRAGRRVASRELERGAADPAALDAERRRLATEIVGGALPAPLERAARVPGETLLAAHEITCREGPLPVGPVSLALRRGEIVAIAGVSGNGQSALVRALVGLVPATSGRVELAGVDVTGAGIAARRRAGLRYIPEDRQRVGLALGASVAENAGVGRLVAGGFRRGPFVARAALGRFAAALVARYRIAVRGVSARARTMSGGNRQKLVVARELERGAALVVAENPTWGVDIGAIDAIHRELVALRDDEHAVLVVSNELDEVLALADRVLVMSAGRIVGELDRASASRTAIAALMTGLAGDGRRAA